VTNRERAENILWHCYDVTHQKLRDLYPDAVGIVEDALEAAEKRGAQLGMDGEK